MNVVLLILQILIIIFVPVLLIRLRERGIVKFLGTIGMAYLIGILLALVIFLLKKLGVNASFSQPVSEYGSHAAIGVAIPLLLFSTNLKKVKRLSKKSLGSFGLLTISVIVVSFITGLAMKNVLGDSDKLSGMAVGLYTGGTPNLNAIGSILGVDGTTIAMSNLADMLIGGVFYMFLLLLCKPMLKGFLNAKPTNYYVGDKEIVDNVDYFSTKDIDKKPLAFSIFIAVLIAVLGAGVGILIWVITGMKDGTMASYLVPAIMITATVLGLLGSCSKRLRETKGTNLVGHYLILVFSVALSMYIDFTKISVSSLYVFLLFAIITVGSFVLHTILCKIFKIDIDCAMVTLTAGLYGPAFIPAITKQIGNDDLTAVGLICGSLGYAIGTFLGVGLGFLLTVI